MNEEEFKAVENLEKGKDYISVSESVIVIDRKSNSYNNGFEYSNFVGNIACDHPIFWREATHEEVKKRFETYLAKRYGADWKTMKIKEKHPDATSYLDINDGSWCMEISKHSNGWSVWNKNGLLYCNGIWVERLEEKASINDMTKEVAKLKLREARSNLKQAEIVIEMHENGIREIKEDIENLEAIINKKDDWRNRGISEDEYVLLMNKVMLIQEMHQFAHVKNEGWLPDWRDADERKWGITLNEYSGTDVDWYDVFNKFAFGIAVKSEEIAKEMLGEFGERIENIYNKQY